MNQISDPPLVQDFGTEFNYALWEANTRISLVNVPWNNDYRDVVKFSSKGELDRYIDQRETTESTILTSYAKVNQPVRLDIPYNKAIRYNYLRASNPSQPIGNDSPRSFYYFITDVRYISPNNTEIVVQLDVWQTFGYDVEFGNCYVERGHIGIANENNFDDNGRTYLTVPEGLDTGGEYRVINVSRNSRMGPSQYHILVASAVDLAADAGDVTNPKLVAADGSYLNNLPSGAKYYVFNSGGSLMAYLNTIKEKSWVGQGILSITLIPMITDYIPGFAFGAHGTPTAAPESVPQRVIRKMKADWRNSNDILSSIPEEYRHLRKFFTYPYMAIEVTTFSGTPLIAKPESWNDSDATVVERVSMIPPNQRITFHPYKYNSQADIDDGIGFAGGVGTDDAGDYIDFATVIQSFPTMAIVNNMASSFLAQNAHGIAFQNSQADWSQQKALRGNQNAYDQASSGMDLANRLGINSRNQDIMSTGLANQYMQQSAIVNGLGGVAGGLGSGMIGGPAGAAIGGASAAFGGMMSNVGAMMQAGHNTDQLALRNSSNAYATGAGINQAGYIRDTNKSLADWAARGDYEQTIAGIQAKVQDSRLTQPTTSGQVGGETINVINNDVEISVRWKFLDLAHVRAIGDYWLRYGYAINRFVQIPRLDVMTKFTYWKMAETYLSAGMMPESFKQAIRGIFEKGVTVWTNPADIGTIALSENTPVGGIRID